GVHLDVALDDRRPGADGVEGGDEAERGAGQVVGAARAGEVDLGLVDAQLLLHLVEDGHEHLDLVQGLLAALVPGLGEGDDGDLAHHAPSRSSSWTSGSPVGRHHLMEARSGRSSSSHTASTRIPILIWSKGISCTMPNSPMSLPSGTTVAHT